MEYLTIKLKPAQIPLLRTGTNGIIVSDDGAVYRVELTESKGNVVMQLYPQTNGSSETAPEATERTASRIEAHLLKRLGNIHQTI